MKAATTQWNPPITWDPMGTDEFIKVVPLSSTSPEYQTIETRFNTTNTGNTILKVLVWKYIAVYIYSTNFGNVVGGINGILIDAAILTKRKTMYKLEYCTSQQYCNNSIYTCLSARHVFLITLKICSYRNPRTTLQCILAYKPHLGSLHS